MTDFVTSEILDTLVITGPGGTATSFFPFGNGSRLYNFFAPIDKIVRLEQGHAADHKTDSSDDKASLTNSANNTNAMDFVIYHGNFTSDTGDSWVLAVLEDFTGPIDGINFDIV